MNKIIFSILIIVPILLIVPLFILIPKYLSVSQNNIVKIIIFKNGDNEITLSCLLNCSAENLPCMERHKGGKYRNVAFKGDDLACNLDYSKINKTVKEWEMALWFYKEPYLEKDKLFYSERKYLNLNKSGEQFVYNLKESGYYGFAFSYLPGNNNEWQISILTKTIPTKIHVYDSVSEYESTCYVIYNISINESNLEEMINIELDE